MKLFFFILSFLFFFASGIHPSEKLKRILQEAEQSYNSSHTDDLLIRQKNLNRALKLYLETEKLPELEGRTKGMLSLKIGNCFYRLGNLPWAAYYTYQSLSLLPRDKNVRKNLNLILQKLALEKTTKPFTMRWFFFFSIPELWQITAFFIFLSLFLVSLFIWYPSIYLKRLLIIVGFASFALLINVILQTTFRSIQAVCLISSFLYTGPSTDVEKAIENPITSGTLLTVLDKTKENEWLKVKTTDGKIGFMPSGKARFLLYPIVE